MESISDIGQLIARIDAGLTVRKTDIAAGAAILDGFYYDPGEAIRNEINQYPYGSPENYEAQMRLIFEPIAGHSHLLEMEGLDTPIDTANCPFPFDLSPYDAGYWTMSYGYMLKCMGLPAGARVLEVGAGPGGLTETLCRARLAVTVVEPRQSNCDYIQKRVSLFGHEVRTISESIETVEFDQTFDAIVFYESFHHMPSPKWLVERLSKHLSPTGMFVFGAEPIQDAGPLIPFPWGFRMNGASLSAIRDVGWVEFGFQEPYFREILEGFEINQHRIEGFAHCDVWIARREEQQTV